ncbi:hypothetical protein [Luteibacter sp. 329MFSha]|uniref:hypothetical protein n=1 Tax=Luteibacter sp. 329MFSha TaxID=1798239 RepID=UPI0008CF69FD|nr:hypothetical protein [Luteibacter sp. 329MFSha]SEW21291.1 hypothetical protein SAMN04515660_3079 [Luteibacter sp. 329MFSha]
MVLTKPEFSWETKPKDGFYANRRKRGHEYEAAGRLKEAFGEYQRVAEYGNSAALITAAMFAMEAGGEKCFARSRLYFGLGGMWGKVQWTSLPGGSPTSRPFEGTTETGDRPL